MAEHESRTGAGGRPVTVAELAALNEEIAALVRAGSPLEAGLNQTGEELPGRLGEVAGRLSSRMNRGESLVEALDAEQGTIPALYRAVVEAGSRTGDLAVALQGLSRYLRGFTEARDAVGLALWYPLMAATVAYVLFLGMATVIAPRFQAAFASFQLPVTRALSGIDALGRSAWFWWPIWPLLLVAVTIGWVRSGRASRFDSGGWSFLSLFPWMRSVVRDYQSAGFAELTALLLENRIAYPKAIMLAAEATGNLKLIAEARMIAVEMERGRTAAEAVGDGSFHTLSPMLRWTLAHGQSEGSLIQGLRNLSPMYRTRAAYRAEKIRLLLPSIIVILVGASSALLYALTLFLPLTGMLNELAGP